MTWVVERQMRLVEGERRTIEAGSLEADSRPVVELAWAWAWAGAGSMMAAGQQVMMLAPWEALRNVLMEETKRPAKMEILHDLKEREQTYWQYYCPTC